MGEGGISEGFTGWEVGGGTAGEAGGGRGRGLKSNPAVPRVDRADRLNWALSHGGI